jgi:hypothetical protein
MISVVETSSEERTKEMKETFDKMRPYLDNGFSYVKAYQMISGLRHNTFSQRWWWKELVKYGESQGYDKNGCSKRRFNTGLYSVGLAKVLSAKEEPVWNYYYIDECMNRKIISHTDLKELRKKVEKRGFPWKVVDFEFARQSYEFNKMLQEKTKVKELRSGVNNVYFIRNNRYKQGYCWRYRNYGKSVYATSLKKLEKKVKERKFNWFVNDEQTYNKTIREEKE